MKAQEPARGQLPTHGLQKKYSPFTKLQGESEVGHPPLKQKQDQ